MATGKKTNSASKDAELKREAVVKDATPVVESEANAEDKKVTFSLNKKKYAFTVESFKFKSKTYTPKSAVENNEVLETLVSTNSFIIKEA